jgi:hypothetical protein
MQHLFHARRESRRADFEAGAVHLMHEELFDELRTDGFEVRPGDIGENVTTGGLDLLALPTGTLLQLGNEAVIEIAGLVGVRFGSFATKPGGSACRLMSASLQKRPDCFAHAK